MTAKWKRPRLSATALKLIAAAAMVFDHCGVLLFPEALWLRAVGRITFPVMAFFIAEGVRKTSNIRRYLARLLLFAAASEIPFNLLNAQRVFYPYGQNIFFTLFLGAAAAAALDRAQTRESGAVAALACCFASELFCCDYGVLGTGLIVLIGLAPEEGPKRAVKPILAFAAVYVLFAIAAPRGSGGGVRPALALACAAGAVPLLLCYDGTRGGGRRPVFAKYFFYLFYPLHILALYACWVFWNHG